MVFNATFTNISAISERSVLLVTETGVPVIRNRVGTQKSLQQFNVTQLSSQLQLEEEENPCM
jgi:hypothetical protein